MMKIKLMVFRRYAINLPSIQIDTMNGKNREDTKTERIDDGYHINTAAVDKMV